MKKITIICATAVGMVMAAWAQSTPPLYENNFAGATPGTVPEDFLVLDGQFAVKEEGGNKFLELPGAPLDAFGVLFGPTEKDGIAVSARIFGTAKGRRFPAFAVSLNGVGGYKLQISPAKKLVELYKGDPKVPNSFDETKFSSSHGGSEVWRGLAPDAHASAALPTIR